MRFFLTKCTLSKVLCFVLPLASNHSSGSTLLSSKIKIFFSKSTTELNAVNLLAAQKQKKITIFASVSSQIFFAVSFFLCLSATNVNISVAQCFIIVPIIFLFAALLEPAGFGPREYSAAIILSFLWF